MSEPPISSKSNGDQTSKRSGDRVVFVMPEDAAFPSGQMSLRELWDVLWHRQFLIVTVTLAFGVIAAGYVILAPKWYRSEALLAPAEETASPSLAGQLGGLAALAGVEVASGNGVEAIAVLRSRELAREFIRDLGLLVVFFEDEWNAEEEGWRGANAEEWPDVRDAVEYFHENVLRVSEDRQTGLISLGIEWTDPDAAATWATELVGRVNTKLRERALREASANVAYLREELAGTNLITLQQSIGRLLESELQKFMLARGNEEFAFRVIDPAGVPKEAIRPRPTLTIIVGTALGAIFGVFCALLIHVLREQ